MLARVAIRVILGEDSYLVREGLRQVLAGAPQIELEAECGDADALLREIEERRPDVVLTDIRMPPTNTDEGIRLAAHLRRAHPDIGVVVLSQYADPGYVLELLESGSEGRAYLLKERVHDRRQLVAAIEAVASGQSVIDPKIVEVLVAAKARGERSPLAELTPRELEVLAAIAEGKSNSAISGVARAHEARGGEAHQRDLPQAQPLALPGGRGRQPARQGGARLPRAVRRRVAARQREGSAHPRGSGGARHCRPRSGAT